MMKRACLVISTSISVLLAATCGWAAEQNAEPKVKVGEGTFKCITDMTPVRHFYVDNLLGNLQGTVAVAEKDTGDYPEGSVLQLVPTEIMIKQQKGFNPTTRDWEFFAIDVSKDGSKIYQRGFENVNNRFGLNCFACHQRDTIGGVAADRAELFKSTLSVDLGDDGRIPPHASMATPKPPSNAPAIH